MVKKRKSQTLGKEKRETMQNVENVKFLAWPNVRNQVVVQKKFFLKKGFPKTIDVAFTHKFENGAKG